MNVAAPAYVEELVQFNSGVSAVLNMSFAVKRVSRKHPHNAGYSKLRAFNNVSVIMPRSIESESTQAWFWTLEWQRGEAQASVEAAAGLGRVYETSEDFLASLDD